MFETPPDGWMVAVDSHDLLLAIPTDHGFRFSLAHDTYSFSDGTNGPWFLMRSRVAPWIGR